MQLSQKGYYFYPRVRGEDTDIQKGIVVSPVTHSESVSETGFK